MSEELDIEAAEYVLGTLSADERARFSARLPAEPELRDAVRRWQSNLAPLDDSAVAEAPPADLWSRIEAAILPTPAAPRPALDAADSTNVVRLERRVAFWRRAAFAGAALAAAFALLAVIDRPTFSGRGDGGRYVAVVDTGGREPALIAEVDTATGLIHIRSLAAEAPAGQSLELWHVAEGQAPRSLGLLQAGLDAQTIQDAAAAGPVEGVIAVSVEPEGGSPTGAPTGPVVYSGRLIPVE